MLIAQDLIGQPPRKRILRQSADSPPHALPGSRRCMQNILLSLVFSNFHIVGFCPLFMLWDFVMWDFVLWDFVRRDFVLCDFSRIPPKGLLWRWISYDLSLNMQLMGSLWWIKLFSYLAIADERNIKNILQNATETDRLITVSTTPKTKFISFQNANRVLCTPV